MQKKGEVTLAFNWIYVAIVGAIVLIGAIAIVGNIKKEARESFYLDAKSYINYFFSQLQENPDAERQLNMQGADLSITCDDFSIKQSERSAVKIPDMPLFSPDMISGTAVGSSAFFEIPFKTTRFTYATGPKIKYLLKNSEEARVLDGFLPENMNRQLIAGYNDFSRKDYDKIRYITFGEAPALSNLGSSASMKDGSVTVLQVEILDDMDSFPDSFGKVTFYAKKNRELSPAGEAYFIDRASLLAALYSEDIVRYYCNLDKAYKRIDEILKVEAGRINSISLFANTDHCNYDKTKELLVQMQTYFAQSSNAENLHQIYMLKKKIMSENRYLERLSCPLFY